MNKNLFPVGTKVRDKLNFLPFRGTVVSEPFSVSRCGNPQYVVQLDKGVWSEGRDYYFTVIVVDESNLKTIS